MQRSLVRHVGVAATTVVAPLPEFVAMTSYDAWTGTVESAFAPISMKVIPLRAYLYLHPKPVLVRGHDQL